MRSRNSTFALAYLGLANICHIKFGSDSVYNESMKDSALIYANIALTYDDQLAEAYIFKGMYYRSLGKDLQALNEWGKRGITGFEGNYLWLAQVYAITGDMDKTFENLKLYDKIGENNVILMSIRNNPLFESMKDEPEFQKIVNDMEARYHAEHERVGRWLEENKML